MTTFMSTAAAEFSAVIQPRPFPASHSGTRAFDARRREDRRAPGLDQHASRRRLGERADDFGLAKGSSGRRSCRMMTMLFSVGLGFLDLGLRTRTLSPKAQAQHLTPHSRLRPQQPGEDALLHVHAVGGLLDDDALRAVDHVVGHFLAAVGRAGSA